MAVPGRTTLMCGTPSSLVAMSGWRENRTRQTPTKRPGAGISQHRWLRVRARGGWRGTPWAASRRGRASAGAASAANARCRRWPATTDHCARWARTTSGSRSPCARIDSRSSRSASAPSPTWCAGRRRPADDRAGRQDDGLVLSAPSIAPGRGAGALLSRPVGSRCRWRSASTASPTNSRPRATTTTARPCVGPLGDDRHAGPVGTRFRLQLQRRQAAANDLPAVNAEGVVDSTRWDLTDLPGGR